MRIRKKSCLTDFFLIFCFRIFCCNSPLPASYIIEVSTIPMPTRKERRRSMNYRVVIHSIDLQDREGFLAFLDAYARKGYEAVRIFRSFTVFRKTETPPRGYSMCFLPEGALQRRKPPAPPIPGLKNGVEIFPVPGEDDVHWAEAVSTHYPDFVPYSLSHAIAVAVRQWVVVPIVLFVLVFLLRSGPEVGELLAAEIRSLFVWAVVFALWAVVVIGREVLAFSVDTMHLRGLRREAETGQRYRIPAARQGLVKVKNCLVMLDIVPVGILVLALILSLTI